MEGSLATFDDGGSFTIPAGVSWLPLVWLCDSVIYLLPLLFLEFSHGWPMRPKNVQSLALCFKRALGFQTAEGIPTINFTCSWSKNTLTTGLDPSSRSLKCHEKPDPGKERFLVPFYFFSPLLRLQQATPQNKKLLRSEQAHIRFAGVQRSSFVSIPWIIA